MKIAKILKREFIVMGERLFKKIANGVAKRIAFNKNKFNIAGKFKKIKSAHIAVVLMAIVFVAPVILTGCSSTDSSLDKVHIMNNGCFITCYNLQNSINNPNNRSDYNNSNDRDSYYNNYNDREDYDANVSGGNGTGANSKNRTRAFTSDSSNNRIDSVKSFANGYAG